MQKLNFDFPLQENKNHNVDTKKKNGVSSLFYLSLWGITGGTSICKAFFSRSFIGLATLALPVNWALYPFKPLKGTDDRNLSLREKMHRIALATISSLIGISLTISYNPLSFAVGQLDLLLFGVEIGALIINLIACRALHKNQTSCQSPVDVKKIYFTVKKLILVGWNFFHRVIKKSSEKVIDPTSDEAIIERTRLLKIKNDNTINKLNKIKKFIEKDQELLSCFIKSYQEREAFSFPRPKKPEFVSFDDALLEALCWEELTEIYLRRLQENLNNFFGNNPVFSALFLEKVKLYQRTTGYFYKEDDPLFLTFSKEKKHPKIELLDD